jgi:hypothetical protein
MGEMDRIDQAKRAIEEAIAKMRPLTVAHEDNATFRTELARLFERQAELLEGLDDKHGADLAKEEIRRHGPADPPFWQHAIRSNETVNSHLEAVVKSFDDGNHAAALAVLQETELSFLDYLRLSPLSAGNYDVLSVI